MRKQYMSVRNILYDSIIEDDRDTFDDDILLSDEDEDNYGMEDTGEPDDLNEDLAPVEIRARDIPRHIGSLKANDKKMVFIFTAIAAVFIILTTLQAVGIIPRAVTSIASIIFLIVMGVVYLTRRTSD